MDQVKWDEFTPIGPVPSGGTPLRHQYYREVGADEQRRRDKQSTLMKQRELADVERDLAADTNWPAEDRRRMELSRDALRQELGGNATAQPAAPAVNWGDFTPIEATPAEAPKKSPAKSSTKQKGTPAAPAPTTQFVQEPTAEELARASRPAQMTQSPTGRVSFEAPIAGQIDSAPAVTRRQPTVIEPTAAELETASRPARMVATRGGQPLIVPESELRARDNWDPETQGERRAPWTGEGGVLEAAPGGMVAGTRNAMANLRRMNAQEGVLQRSDVINNPSTGETRGGGVSGRVAPGALDRQERLLTQDRADLERARLDADRAAGDLKAITPHGMNLPQEAFFSAASSAPPTLAGIAAGILTRSPHLAMAIAGGGGSAMAAGSTYGEAMEKGAGHRMSAVAASIDAILEGVGEALPLGIALKRGSPIGARIYGTMLAEAGQEAATQLMQDLNALLSYNPNLTAKEAWHNLKVAALAGGMGGAAYGGLGAAANIGRGEDEAKDVPLRSNRQPEVYRSNRPAPAPARGSDTDLANVMADKRPLPEIRAEQDARDRAEAEARVRTEGAAGLAGLDALFGVPKTATNIPQNIPGSITSEQGTDIEGEFTEIPPENGPLVTSEGSGNAGPIETQPDTGSGNQAGGVQPAKGEATPKSPIIAETPEHVDQAAARTDHNATPAEIEAGIQRKGVFRFGGIHPLSGIGDIAIETARGEVRTATDGSWQSPPMPAHYGEIKRARGADGDKLDVFVGEDHRRTTVYVIDQIDPKTKQFDEHKAMIAFRSMAEALEAYYGSYSDDARARVGMISELGARQFVNWVRNGDTKKAFNYQPPKQEAPNASDVQPTDEGRETEQPGRQETAGQESAGTGGQPAGTVQREPADDGPESGAQGDVPATPVDGGKLAYRVGKHTKTGADLHIVSINERVSSDEYQRLKRDAKNFSGFYSKFVKGFIFPSEGQANKFIAAQKPEQRAPQPAPEKKPAVIPEKRPEPAPQKPEPKAADLGNVSADDFDALIDDVQAEIEGKKPNRPEPVRIVKVQIVPTRAGIMVQDIDQNGNKVGPPRWPDEKANAGSTAASAERKPAPEKRPSTPQVPPLPGMTPLGQKDSSESLKEAGQHAKAGVKAGLAGLDAMFGRKGTLGSGPVFDEETWKKAKPHFDAAYAEFVAAGKSLREFVNSILLRYKDNIDAVKPYLKRWFDDTRLRLEKPDGSGEGTLGGISPGEVPSPDGSGDAGTGATSGGVTDAEGNGRSDPDGSGDPRGVGDGETKPPDIASGGTGTGGGTGGTGIRQPGGNESNAPPDGPAVVPGAPYPKATNFVITDELELGKGTPIQKYRDNVAAIRLLKLIESDHRAATPDEQKILARYVGWGGIKQAFPNPNNPPAKGWEQRVAEIKELLTPEEHEAAARSIQDAHYTSRLIVDAIWGVSRRLGFDGGRVLEPSMGTGNFFGLIPPELRASSQLFGIEQDSITARIAKHLYPQADIRGPVGFQDVKLADNHFNLNVGNPPFGTTALYDPNSKHLKGFSLHNFFFAKSIDKLAPGGLHIQVVSRYFMDSKTNTARKYIANKTKLIGAIRLPWTAFYENANTEVVTDIVILQKLEEQDYGTADMSWTETTEIPDPLGHDDITVNKYFAEHPEMIVGTLERSGEMRTEFDVTVQPDKNIPLAHGVMNAMMNLPEGIYYRGKREAQVKDEQTTAAAPQELIENYSVGSFFTKDGKIYQRTHQDDGSIKAREITENTPYSEKETWGPTRVARLRGQIGIRDVARRLLKAETTNRPERHLTRLRKMLNHRYDEFVKEWGYLNETANERVFRDDSVDAPLLSSLEDNFDRGIKPARAKALGIPERKPSADKATIFRQRVIHPYTEPTSAANVEDAVSISLSEKGKVSVPYIAKLTSLTEPEVIEQLTEGDMPMAFLDPVSGEYETPNVYLSGNVKRKHKALVDRGMGNTKQATILKAAFPPDVTAADIDVRMGASWVSDDDYEAFVYHLLGDTANAYIRYIPGTGGFAVNLSGGDPALSTVRWGTSSRPATDLIKRILNNKDMAVYRTDEDGNRYVDVEATAAANDKAEEIRAEFDNWLFDDRERRERLVKQYNDTMNTDVAPKYDGSYLKLPGKVPDAIIKMRRGQLNAISRIIRTGKVLLDHVVGAGKTFTMIAAAMEMRRMGLIKKPMFVVPNHLVNQWATDFYKLYPGAKILAMGKKDFEKTNRSKMLARVATGDWDAVIFAHSSFGFIGNDKEIVAEAFRQQIEDIQQAIDAARAAEGKKSRTASQYQRRKEAIEQKLKELLDKPRDPVLTFQEIGVDQLFVDESQEFKNLFFTTQRQGVGGFGNPTGSKKAFGLSIKTSWLQKTNKGRGVVFATGTPVSNSLTEIFTLLRYMSMDVLEERGMKSLDAWLSNFGVITSEFESNVTGTKYKRKERLRELTNAPELMPLYKSFTDSVTNEQIKQWYREDNQGQEFPLPAIRSVAEGKRNARIIKRIQELFKGDIDVTEFDASDGYEFLDQDTLAKWTEIKSELEERLAATGTRAKKAAAIVNGIEKILANDGMMEAEGDDPAFITQTRAIDKWKKVESVLEEIIDPKQKSRENIGVPATAAQKAFSARLQHRFENLKRGGPDNALVILTDGRKSALDMRLVIPGAPDNPKSKIHAAADRIKQIYDANDLRNGTQLVFLDLSTPVKHGKKDAAKFLKRARELLGDPDLAKFGDLRHQWHELQEMLINRMNTVDEDQDGTTGTIDRIEKFLEQADEIEAAVTAADTGFSVYDDLRRKLIDRGIKPHEIAFIHDFNTDLQKEELFDSVNAGAVRVLMGSTMKMGAGTNVQRKAVALHHLDVPWRPSDVEQREGRVVRQGNEFRDPKLKSPHLDPNFEVEIMAYVTIGTSETFLWQIQEQKITGIDSLRNYKGQRRIEEVSNDSMSAAEMKAIASGNPLILEEVQLTDQIRKLEGQRKRFVASKRELESQIAKYEADIVNKPQIIERLKEPAAAIEKYGEDPYEGNPPRAEMDGVQVTRKEAMEKLENTIATAETEAKITNGPIEARRAEIKKLTTDGSLKPNTPEFEAASKEYEQLGGQIAKPSWSIVFDGEAYTAKTTLQQAIIDKLGDAFPIRVVVDGKPLIHRSDIKAKLDPIIKKMYEDKGGSVTFGTIAGLPIELDWVEPKGGYIGSAVEITIAGETETAKETITIVPGKDPITTKLDGSSVIGRLRDVMSSVLHEYKSAKLAYTNATHNIEKLKSDTGGTWGKDLELDAKRERLKIVKGMLERGEGSTDTDTNITDADLSDIFTPDEIDSLNNDVTGGAEWLVENYPEWKKHGSPTDVAESALPWYQAVDNWVMSGKPRGGDTGAFGPSVASASEEDDTEPFAMNAPAAAAPAGASRFSKARRQQVQASRGRPALHRGQRIRPAGGIPAAGGGADPLRVRAIITILREALKIIPVRQGRIAQRRALGIYKPGVGVIRQRVMDDIEVFAHEAGHAISERYKNWLLPMQQRHRIELEAMAYPGVKPKDMMEEGFAEFIRMYETNRTYAERNAPHFAADFRAKMQASDSYMLSNLDAVSHAYDTWLSAPSTAVVKASIIDAPEKENIISKLRTRGAADVLKNLATTAYTHYVDDKTPLRVAVEMLRRIKQQNLGQPSELKAADDAYKLARLSVDAYSSGHMDITKGVRDYDSVHASGHSLGEAISKAIGETAEDWSTDNIREFESYLVSRRAIHEWDRYNAGDLRNQPTKESKADHEQNIIDLEAKHPNYDAGAQMIYDWANALWQKKYDAGLITEEAYNAGLALHKDYVPFMRDREDDTKVTGPGVNATGKQSALKAFHGSQRDIISPLQSLMKDAYTTAQMISRNDTIRALAKLAKTSGVGSGAIAEQIPASQVSKSMIPVDAMLNHISNNADWMALSARDAQSLHQTIEMLDQMDMPAMAHYRAGVINERGEPIVFWWEDGKRKALRLADKDFGIELYRTITGLGKEQANLIVKILAAPAAALRYGVTIDPSFFLANILRDQVAAWVLSPDGYTPFVDAGKGLYGSLTSGDMTRIYNSFGGIMGGSSVAALDNMRISRDIKALREKGVNVRKYAHWRTLAHATEISETGTRIGLFTNSYEAARARGLTEKEAAIEAAFLARDFIDFGRSGSRMLLAKRTITFLNAGLQGLDKAVRVLGGQGNVQKALTPFFKQQAGMELSADEKRQLAHSAKAWARVAVLVVVSLIAAMLGSDDEEYDSFSSYLKATHWLFKVGDKWVAYPKPYELAFLANIAELAWDAIARKDPGAWSKLGERLWPIMVPPHTVAAVAVPVEVWANKRFYDDRDIVPESVLGREPYLRYNRYTSELSKAIGKATNISPAVLDHFIVGWGGSLARTGLELTNLTNRNRPELGLEDAPVTRRFIREASRGSEPSQQFWKLVGKREGEFLASYNTFKFLAENGSPGEARKYLDKLTEDKQVYIIAKRRSALDRENTMGIRHPIERAQKVLQVISGLRDEIAGSAQFDAHQKRVIDDELGRIAMSEARNALISIEHKRFQNRETADITAKMDRLREVSEEAHEILTRRLNKKAASGSREGELLIPKAERVYEGYDKLKETALRVKDAVAPAVDDDKNAPKTRTERRRRALEQADKPTAR